MHYFNINTVIFDMDGVITNTMPDHYKAWVEILKRHGITATHHDIYLREGQKGIDSVREIFATHKKPFNRQQAQKILKDKEEYFKRIVKRRFVLGTRSFLKDLYRQQFKLGLVTGTSRHELQQILPQHIYNLFTVIVTGNDVRDGKPHPEPYLTALKKLDIKSSQAVVIENAPFGISSAKCAGLRCLAIETSLPKAYLKKADLIFRSIAQLRQKVRFILNKG